jgi:phosphatidylglycerol:prolipoprotein diacylglycerol transferase
VQPEISIGPLTLQTFGICFAFAFLASGWLVARRLDEIGEPADWAYELIFCALIGGLVGARIDFLIQNWDEASEDLLGSIFSGSGLVWLGGLIGGALGVVLWARWRGFLGLRLLDLCAPGLALGYAIGRVGCQLSGDGDYGKPSDVPWAMSYPDGTVPTDDQVHPTPVYEALAMGLAALVLWRLRDRYRPGILFAIYLVIAGVERLLIEFIRRNDEVALGLTLPQIISVGMLVAGLVWIARAHRAGGLGVRTAPQSA